MKSWSELTLGDIGRGLNRYRPFLLVIVSIVLVVAFLPGDRGKGDELTTTAGNRGDTATGAAGDAQPTDSTITSGEVAGGEAGGGAGGRSGGGRGGGRAGAGGAGGTSGGRAVPASVGADCDPASGGVRLPVVAAPPCVPALSGYNGG